MKCCNYDENCPEWTVIKNKFILIDDWNDYLVCDLEYVDSMFIFNTTKCKNTNGIEIKYKNQNDNEFYVAMTQKQYDELLKSWDKFKKKNKKMFEEENEDE